MKILNENVKTKKDLIKLSNDIKKAKNYNELREKHETFNQIIKMVYGLNDDVKLNTFKNWKKEGFKIKKGSKAYTFWTAPKKGKNKDEEGEENEYKFFGICKLYTSDQVERFQPVSEAEGKQEEKFCVMTQNSEIIEEKKENELEEVSEEMQIKIDAYEEKRENKKNYYKNMAEKSIEKANINYKNAREISSHIPFGQPILVGHHSEGRHRRDLKRIDNNMRKSVEQRNKAEYYKQKARAVENNRAISSDDPQAVKKLKEKLEGLEKAREKMKSINKEYRRVKGDISKMDLPEAQKKQLQKTKDEWNFGTYIQPYPSFTLTNTGAEVRRLKKRIEKLEKASSAKTYEKHYGEIRFVDNVEENRVQFFFPGKPEEETRKILKNNGFKWSNRNGCWQRFRANAYYSVKRVIEFNRYV